MRIITVLNRCHKFKGFVYVKANFKTKGGKDEIEVKMVHRKNSHGHCSKCGKACPGYDKLPERRFEFIPLWGFLVFLLYSRRRVNCDKHGIIAEKLPWAKGKNHLTNAYMQFLAHWAKKLSWKEVAISFGSSWGKVFRSIEYVVTWGLEHRQLNGISAIGVDEVLWHKGHKYLTLVYQINSNCTRLLWIGKDRKEKTFQDFFNFLGEERTLKLEHVCSDMWKPYLKVIKQNAVNAIHILDRFHIVARLNKALDKVRAQEHRQMKEDGYEAVLTKSRWLLLKKPANLTEGQSAKLKDLLKYNLKSLRAYLLKEEFQFLWCYVSPAWAGKFIDRWTTKVMRSKIEPLKKEALTIRRHKDLILNWFRAKKAFNSGVVEGLNTKVKLTVRKSYGFRTLRCTEIALYHTLGKLPEPTLTHKFW
jgi:transposase